MQNADMREVYQRLAKKFESKMPYNWIDHVHDWQDHENDSYCPICGTWKSQISALRD